MGFIRALIVVIIVAPIIATMCYLGWLFLVCAYGIVKDFRNSFRNEHIDSDGNVTYYDSKEPSDVNDRSE